MRAPAEDNAVEFKTDVIDRLTNEVYSLIYVDNITEDTIGVLSQVKAAVRNFLILNLRKGCFISSKTKELKSFISLVTPFSFNKDFSIGWGNNGLILFIEGKRIFQKPSDQIMNTEVYFNGRKDAGEKSGI